MGQPRHRFKPHACSSPFRGWEWVRTKRAAWSQEEAVAVVRALGEYLGRVPTALDLQTYGNLHQQVHDHAGGIANAQRLAGFTPNHARRKS